MEIAGARSGCALEGLPWSKASKWSESAHRFLRSCVAAGNLEACYLFGMIHFYCLEHRGGGIALLSRAAVAAHPSALYALAAIEFNGNGGGRLRWTKSRPWGALFLRSCSSRLQPLGRSRPPVERGPFALDGLDERGLGAVCPRRSRRWFGGSCWGGGT